MLWLGQRAFQLLQDEIQSQSDNIESLQTWAWQLDNDLNELRQWQSPNARSPSGMGSEKDLRRQNERLDFMNERNAIVMDMLKREFSEAIEELESSNQVCMLADLLEEEREDGQESEQEEEAELDGTTEAEVPELSGEPREIDVESASEESMGEQASEDGSDGESGREDAREVSERPARTSVAADGPLIRVRLPWLQEAEEDNDFGETY